MPRLAKQLLMGAKFAELALMHDKDHVCALNS